MKPPELDEGMSPEEWDTLTSEEQEAFLERVQAQLAGDPEAILNRQQQREQSAVEEFERNDRLRQAFDNWHPGPLH